MSRLRDFMRQWLGIRDLPPVTASVAVPDTARDLRQLNRQVAVLRGLLHQQHDLTVEALHRAGWQTDEEAAEQQAIQQAMLAVRGDGDVLVGPWTGEVGFELLYWIPFLNWLTEQGLEGRRMVVVSRGGAGSWYRHLTPRYVDILDLVSPSEFRERTAGPKKQMNVRREFDRHLLALAREKLSLRDGPVVHPSAMFRLFAPIWRKRVGVDLVDSFTTYSALTRPAPLTPAERPVGLPARYLVAKFYFSKAFPDSMRNREFIADLLKRVSQDVPVVLLSTSVRLDEHSDFSTSGDAGLHVVDAHTVPQNNLDLQTRLIAHAKGFIGTYGGFSYLAPFMGVRSLSFFSRRFGFEGHHLEIADRVFDQLLPGGFLALDRRALKLVHPAVGRWMDEAPTHARETADEDTSTNVLA